MQVDFIVPGYSKCGSTTLCALLDRHPQIHMGRTKECNYFSYNFEYGANWYEDVFAERAPGQIVGDGSVGYATGEFAAVAAERILAHSPDVRLIFIARDPIRRLVSSYKEMHDSGWKFGVAADMDIAKTLQSLPNMIEDTRYWSLLDTFRDHFADDRLHFVFLDDLERDPASVLRGCLEFLGVDPDFPVPNVEERLNSASEKRYDSPLMRYIHRTPRLGRRWDMLPSSFRIWLENTFRLRRTFRGPVVWPPETLSNVKATLAEESRSFLEHTGRPVSKWPWVAGHFGQQDTTRGTNASEKTPHVTSRDGGA